MKKWFILIFVLSAIAFYFFKEKKEDEFQNELNEEVIKNEERVQNNFSEKRENIKKKEGPYIEEVNNGVKLLNSGKYSDGVKALLDVLNKDPKNEMALEELALYYLEEGQDISKAREFLLKLYHANQDNMVAFSELIYVLGESGGSGEVESFLQDVLKKDPDSLNSNMAYAQFLSREGRVSEAVPVFEKMNELRPNGEGLEDLAYIYSQNGDFEKSANTYEKVVEMKEKMIEESKGRGDNIEDLADDLFNTKIEYAIMKMESRNCGEADSIYKVISGDKENSAYLKFFQKYKENCQ